MDKRVKGNKSEVRGCIRDQSEKKGVRSKEMVAKRKVKQKERRLRSKDGDLWSKKRGMRQKEMSEVK